MTGPLFVGIDLAWSTGTTGIAAVDEAGRLLTSATVVTNEQIIGWLDGLGGVPRVVGVDAPLVVPNETGQRPAERLIGSAYGRYGASAHSANRRLLGGDPRAARLARRRGWSVDPDLDQPGVGTTCIEVYPHPALVGLFGLPYRLGYKKGRTASRHPAFQSLLHHLETVPELDLTSHPRWREIRDAVARRTPGVISRYEDEVDSVLCAHLAWLWAHRPGSLQVYGTVAEGYIVAPPPPEHPPVRPNRPG